MRRANPAGKKNAQGWKSSIFRGGTPLRGRRQKRCAGGKFDALGAKTMRGRGRPGKGKCAAPQAQEKMMRGCNHRPIKRMRGE